TPLRCESTVNADAAAGVSVGSRLSERPVRPAGRPAVRETLSGSLPLANNQIHAEQSFERRTGNVSW
ncbi:hypothetical protein KUCAC02_016821, partial [Chaenocephalus aceratus]